MTYEDIVKANESIRTTDIKGKDYAEVNQRVKAFRMVYPEGTIATEIISNENGICVFQARVYDEVNHLLGVGHAYEKEGSSFINKTSHLENSETSAIGRALGFCGFGIDTSIASYEEVANAKMNHGEERDVIVSKIMNYVGSYGLDAEKVFKKAKINALDDLPTERLEGMLNWLNDMGTDSRKELM